MREGGRKGKEQLECNFNVVYLGKRGDVSNKQNKGVYQDVNQ